MPSWVVGVAASSWGIVMAIAPVLQIVRIVRRGSAEDVSIGYFGLLIPGFLLWIAYGATMGDLFLIVPNVLATTTAVGVIAVTLFVRGREQPPRV